MNVDIGVLGAGTMGAGSLQVAAEARLDVIVRPGREAATERARRRIQGFPRAKIRQGPAHRGTGACGGADQSGSSLGSATVADLVVEAIPEEIELKRDAFRRLDAVTEGLHDPGHEHELALRRADRGGGE